MGDSPPGAGAQFPSSKASPPFEGSDLGAKRRWGCAGGSSYHWWVFHVFVVAAGPCVCPNARAGEVAGGYQVSVDSHQFPSGVSNFSFRLRGQGISAQKPRCTEGVVAHREGTRGRRRREYHAGMALKGLRESWRLDLDSGLPWGLPLRWAGLRGKWSEVPSRIAAVFAVGIVKNKGR